MQKQATTVGRYCRHIEVRCRLIIKRSTSRSQHTIYILVIVKYEVYAAYILYMHLNHVIYRNSLSILWNTSLCVRVYMLKDGYKTEESIAELYLIIPKDKVLLTL